MNKKHMWRYNLVGGLMFIMPLMVVFQMVRIKVNPRQVEKLISVGKAYSGEYQILTPARGRIYDRWGSLMVGNKTAYEVGIEIRKVRNPSTIAQTSEMVLGLDYADVFAAASLEATDTAVYRVVATNVEEEKINQLILLIEQMQHLYGSSCEKDAPSLSGLAFKPHLQRIYPDNELASNIIGFVNREESAFLALRRNLTIYWQAMNHLYGFLFIQAE